MRYLVTTEVSEPFFTEWYSDEMFNALIKMIVYDLQLRIYTADGIRWNDIEEDNL